MLVVLKCVQILQAMLEIRNTTD